MTQTVWKQFWHVGHILVYFGFGRHRFLNAFGGTAVTKYSFGARLGSARLGLGPARLGSARLGSARLGSARPGSANRIFAPCPGGRAD